MSAASKPEGFNFQSPLLYPINLQVKSIILFDDWSGHGIASVAYHSLNDFGSIPAHEFHYFDSENCGEDFRAEKPLSSRGWNCIHGSKTMMAGFPHLYYFGNPSVPKAFLTKCLEYKKGTVNK